MVARSLVLCHSCGFDLRKHPDGARRKAGDGEVSFQRKLLDGISQGWVEVRPGERVYSHLYFTALHQLLRLMTTGPKAEMIRNGVSGLCGIDSPSPMFSGKHGRDVERLNVGQRRALLIMGDYLLREWPLNFIAFCRRHRVWSSTLLKDFERAPFWFWRAVHDHLYRPSYCPSDEEVRSAIGYLSRAGAVPTTKAISKCLGVNNVLRKRKAKSSFAALPS